MPTILKRSETSLFQDYLVHRGLSDQKHAPFLAHWVDLYLSFSAGQESTPFEIGLERFLKHISLQPNFQGVWQAKQV